MDIVPKFVQLIKWVQEQVGVGSVRVRAPRLELSGTELEEAKAVFKRALASRPAVNGRSFAEFAGA
jgi:1-pyrroline-4-hydroxy-2-carboxylate deaminase